MVKLNKKRIRWLVNRVVKDGEKPSNVASVYNVSERRVQQLAKQYRETKKYPELNNNRRPKTSLSDKQKEAINKAYEETKLSPKLLYYELKRRGEYAPKNKLYAHLKSKGRVKDEPKKQKKRKRCRYEWPHTGDMLHSDYHRTSENHPHAIFWLDDASRKILAGGEFEEATAKNAIATFKEAQTKLKEVDWHIKRVNTDRGPQFFNNKPDKKGNRPPGEFEKYLESQNIQFIPSRRNNPQTNGKAERRWLEYDRHRWRFDTLQEWINFHNDRLTTSLDIQHYQTPNTAFTQKLPNLLNLFFKRWDK